MNIVPYLAYNITPEKKFYQDQLPHPLKTFFHNAINEYRIGHDEHIREYATVFILPSPPKTPEEPRLKLLLKKYINTIYDLGLHNDKNRVPYVFKSDMSYIDTTKVNTETAVPYVFDEFIKNITLDFAIVNPDNTTYTYFDIPEIAQNVFKVILEQGDFISSDCKQYLHVRIVLHNEKPRGSWEKYANPTRLLEKIWKHPHRNTYKIPYHNM